MPGRDRDFARVNTEGLSNLLEVAKESEAKSFVHLSTLEVYGFGDPMIVPESEPKPGDEYQSSKLLAERTLLEYAKRSPSPKITILRAARAFGSRDTSFVVPLLRMVEAGSVVLPPSGSMSFSHPKDIAEAMYLAASKPSLGKNLFLIKSFDTEPATLAVSLSKAVGETPSVKTEGPFTKSRLPPYTRAQLRAHLRLDSDEGWSELGYSPKFDLTAACDEIANWYKREPWATEQD
jgi:nucleoside-diphosphate-sugar epimerase